MSIVHYTDIKERKCPECGKTFIVPPQNVYKERVGYEIKPFCSWRCLCAWRNSHPEKDDETRGGGRPTPCVKMDKDGNILAYYAKIVDAARENGVSTYRISTRLNSGEYDEKFECYWRYAEDEDDDE